MGLFRGFVQPVLTLVVFILADCAVINATSRAGCRAMTGAGSGDLLASVSYRLTGAATSSGPLSHCDNTAPARKKVSERCLRDVCRFGEDLNNRERYASEMMDSMGKFPSGLAKANFKWIGTKSQCLRATLDSTDIHAKYCLTGYDLPVDDMNATMSDAIAMGICVPESCSEDEVRHLILEGKLPLPPVAIIGTFMKLSFVYCTYERSLSTGAIVMICITALLVFFVVCGTIYEYYKMRTAKTTEAIDQVMDDADEQNENESIWKELLLSFSAISNGSRILDATAVDHGVHTMRALYGFRVLSFWWVLLGQTFSFNARFMYNFFDISVILDFIFSQASMNYRFAEDSFFLLSGLLITYYSLSRLHEEGRENWFYFYIHRIWRLSAPYFLAFFGYIYLIKYLCTGPLQHYLHEDLQACYDNWWSYILYMNNLYPFPGNLTKTCAPWFWFMACLMQFYIISPPIIYLLYRWAPIGLGTVAGLIGVCVACTTAIANHYHMPISVSQIFNGYMDLTDPSSVHALDDYIETKPYCRMTPYLVGMAIGYLIVKYGKTVKIGKVVSVLCWAISTFVALAIIYGLYWTYQGYELTEPLTLFYHACSKLGYSLAVGWVVYACVTGNADKINRFLSWKFWRPLHRLTFSAYLLHAFAFDMYIYNSDTLFFLSFANMTYIYASYVGIAYTAAFLFALIVEKPMLRIDGVLYRKWKHRKSARAELAQPQSHAP